MRHPPDNQVTAKRNYVRYPIIPLVSSMPEPNMPVKLCLYRTFTVYPPVIHYYKLIDRAYVPEARFCDEKDRPLEIVIKRGRKVGLLVVFFAAFVFVIAFDRLPQIVLS